MHTNMRIARDNGISLLVSKLIKQEYKKKHEEKINSQYKITISHNHCVLWLIIQKSLQTNQLNGNHTNI